MTGTAAVEAAMAAGDVVTVMAVEATAATKAGVKIPVTTATGSEARGAIPQAGKVGAAQVPGMADHVMAVPEQAAEAADTGMKTANPGAKDNTTIGTPVKGRMYHSSPLTSGWPITSRNTKWVKVRGHNRRTRGPMAKGPAEKPGDREKSPTPVTTGRVPIAVAKAETVTTGKNRAGMTGSGRADRTGGPETVPPNSSLEHHGDRARLQSRHRRINHRQQTSQTKKGYCPAS
ncbi:hypothetical protein AGMMS49579_27160 [Spirochaetia bacterium]|nr:hypothetical protein AGMMS49579_27160 [Spirochaetia bacterium]